LKVVVSPEAAADLVRLRSFLESTGTSASGIAATAIDEPIGSLAAFPERGRPSGTADVRELLVPFGRSAYILRYAYLTETEALIILRIWHGREER
jgi:plasmid stabilization system protein ParE